MRWEKRCQILLIYHDELPLRGLWFGGFDLLTSGRRPFGLEAKEGGVDSFRLLTHDDVTSVGRAIDWHSRLPQSRRGRFAPVYALTVEGARRKESRATKGCEWKE